jgi:hypothetical protein
MPQNHRVVRENPLILDKISWHIQQESQQQPSETLKLNIGKSTETYRRRVVSCSYESRQEAAMHWNSLWDRNRQATTSKHLQSELHWSDSCDHPLEIAIFGFHVKKSGGERDILRWPTSFDSVYDPPESQLLFPLVTDMLSDRTVLTIQITF